MGETSEKLWALPLLTVKSWDPGKRTDCPGSSASVTSQIGSLWAVPVPPIVFALRIDHCFTGVWVEGLRLEMATFCLSVVETFDFYVIHLLTAAFLFHLAGQDLRYALVVSNSILPGQRQGPRLHQHLAFSLSALYGKYGSTRSLWPSWPELLKAGVTFGHYYLMCLEHLGPSLMFHP